MAFTVIKKMLAVVLLSTLASGCGEVSPSDQEPVEKPVEQLPAGGEITKADVQAVKSQLVFDDRHLLTLAPSAKSALTPMQYDFAQKTIDRNNWITLNSGWSYGDEPNGQLIQRGQGPITAMSFCGPVVDSITWINRSGMWSDSITPTYCGKYLAIDTWDAWNEVIAKTPPHPSWDKAYGTSTYWSMYDQFTCHFAFGFWKDQWNLEPSRPNVGLPATVAALCNP